MVYTQALVFGHGATVLSEEDTVGELFRRFVSQFLPPGADRDDGRFEKTSSMESLGPREDEDYMDELLQQDLVRRIELCLSAAKASLLHCQELHLPRCLTSRVARDITRCSVPEPCGVRGALIQVYLESEGALQPLGSIAVDGAVTPTFELSVVFKGEPAGWPALKRLFAPQAVLRLSGTYRLVKRKLYSSAGPIICESH